EKVFFKTFVKLFEAESNISVNLSYVTPANLIAQIEAEHTAGVIDTDVIMVDTAHMSPYIENGWMQDVAAILGGFSGRTITNRFAASMSQGNKVYFVPVSMDIYISIYNVAALPYMPVSVTVTRGEDDRITQIDAITWEEYAAWAITIKAETGFAKAGFPMAAMNSQLLYPMGGMALAFGEESFPNLNGIGAMAAWGLISQMVTADAFIAASVLASVNQPTALLNTGALWLGFGHLGPIGAAYDAAPEQYILGPTPAADATGIAGSTVGAWAYGIVAGAPHSAVAGKWLEFMTDPEINYLYCSGLGGVISPIEEAISQLGTSNTDRIMAIGIAMFQNDSHIAIVDTMAYTSWDEVKAIYLELFRYLLTGEELTQAQADGYQAELDALLVSP
ncbi:MAG: extracellular solute-binding protein, partial [bacterium]